MKYLKKILQFVGIITVLLSLVFAVKNGFLISAEPVVNKEVPQPIYGVSAVPIPSDLNFAGERVPLSDPEVLERIDKELLVNTYWQSNALLLIKRSKKYFPIMRPILEKHGIPEDFLYLAVAESGLEPLKSPAGAAGFWQLMPKTAKDFKLEVNKNVDERYHIEKATHVACKYILKSKEKLGSWTLAAAAYNAGNRGVSRQLERQKTDNYYDLLFGQETARYVFRILAIKTILKNPDLYGFSLSENDYYKQEKTRKLEVRESLKDLSDFAQRNGFTYKALKRHNPWLRQTLLNNASKRVYTIQIPLKESETTVVP